MISQPSMTAGLQYVDTHCHVDLYADPRAVMQEALEQRVAVVAVTNTPSVFEPMLQLAAAFPNVVVALGLHPELAGEREPELSLIPNLSKRTRFVGEVGLDGMKRDPRSQAAQRRVLESFVRCAATSTLMTVHSRRATSEVLNALAGTPAKVVLHWFSGTVSQAREAAARGWLFSVNAAMLSNVRGRALVAALPRELVLTETDGPFVMVDGRPSRPVDVRQAIETLASIWDVDSEEARRLILDNFSRCLSTL
jgi:TatD DNase family protein